MKKYIILVIEILFLIACPFLLWLLPLINSTVLRVLLIVSANLLMGLSAFIAIKLSGIQIDFEWKNYKQYFIGVGICVALLLVLGLIPALCGYSLFGPHVSFNWFDFIYNLLFYILVVGPVEELIFRVYFQETFVMMLKKNKWLGVVIAAALFGLWHLINGSLIQVLFTFVIGLVFGLAKYFIKNLHYPGIALCHGLYDFLGYIVTLTIV